MLCLGGSLKDIQTWLGHSNYNFTADTYIHSASSAHQQMASTLADHLPALQGLTAIPEGMCSKRIRQNGSLTSNLFTVK